MDAGIVLCVDDRAVHPLARSPSPSRCGRSSANRSRTTRCRCVRSSGFWKSLGIGLPFSARVLGIQVPLGIGVAVALPRRGLMVPACLVIVSLPLLMPWNIIPIVWLGFIDTDTGLLGRAIAALGLHPDRKFDPVHTWLAILLMDTWHWAGLVVLPCYSSLTTIPGAYYRAASIDSRYGWTARRRTAERRDDEARG